MDDFQEKLRCFQIKLIRSIRIRFPSFGAGGHIRDAGVSARVFAQENSVAPIVQITAAPEAISAYCNS